MSDLLEWDDKSATRSPPGTYQEEIKSELDSNPGFIYTSLIVCLPVYQKKQKSFVILIAQSVHPQDFPHP